MYISDVEVPGYDGKFLYSDLIYVVNEAENPVNSHYKFDWISFNLTLLVFTKVNSNLNN